MSDQHWGNRTDDMLALWEAVRWANRPSEEEIRQELEVIRELVAKGRGGLAAREGRVDCKMLWGAQQALSWVIGMGIAPSALEGMMRDILAGPQREDAQDG